MQVKFIFLFEKFVLPLIKFKICKMEEQFKEQFVPYELSLKLKEIGFDERCLAGYYNDGKSLWFFRFHKNSEREPTVAERFATAPLWQQAFDWFKVNKNLYADIYRTGKLFSANIEDMLMCNSLCEVVKEVGYQEARQACLEKLIELAETKKDSV